MGALGLTNLSALAHAPASCISKSPCPATAQCDPVRAQHSSQKAHFREHLWGARCPPQNKPWRVAPLEKKTTDSAGGSVRLKTQLLTLSEHLLPSGPGSHRTATCCLRLAHLQWNESWTRMDVGLTELSPNLSNPMIAWGSTAFKLRSQAAPAVPPSPWSMWLC
jgi:hypothetical protein